VQCTIYDFDGNMPGTSTAYKTYWAEDPYAAVARLESRLEAVAEWMEALGTDAETLIALEDRLGVTVDRDDPMLPAVVAMERALRKMCGRT
jgi:phosphopantetheine adenylyltransferase